LGFIQKECLPKGNSFGPVSLWADGTLTTGNFLRPEKGSFRWTLLPPGSVLSPTSFKPAKSCASPLEVENPYLSGMSRNFRVACRSPLGSSPPNSLSVKLGIHMGPPGKGSPFETGRIFSDPPQFPSGFLNARLFSQLPSFFPATSGGKQNVDVAGGPL